MNMNEVKLTGMLQFSNLSLLHLSASAEVLVSIALNLDMLATLKDSFNRSRHLVTILTFIKVYFLYLVIHTIIVIKDVLNKLSEYDKVSIENGLYAEMSILTQGLKVPLRGLYFVVSSITILVMIQELIKR